MPAWRFGSGGSLWKSKNPYSLEYLKYLNDVLRKNERVTESNKKVLVEALRFISEILIWGDQNDSSVFDFFLERQMLAHFLQIMRQESGSSLCVQLLQTLNILFENIRHETSLYFLLSNNHVNEIITHKFDLKNEEIMAYYISFIKTLSMKLNPATIHFFFNEATHEFPLLTESLKHFNAREGMVRIAVQTVFLNIVRVPDDGMYKFIQEASKEYLKEVVDQLVGACIDLDLFVRSAENVQANRERLRNKVDELIDTIHYIDDLLRVGDCMGELARLLRARLLFPLLLNSLAPRRDDSALLLSPVTTLFFTAQFIQIVGYGPLAVALLSALLFEDLSTITSHWTRAADSFCLQPSPPPQELPQAEPSRVFYEKLLSSLDVSITDDYVAFFALYVVYAIFENRGKVDELLLAARVPHRSSKTDDEMAAELAECPVAGASQGRTADAALLAALRQVVASAARIPCRLRAVTLQLACLVLRHFVLSLDCNQVHHEVEVTAEETRVALVNRLASYASEPLFIDMFDNEFAEFETCQLRLESLSHEMLLPPSNSPLSGLALNKRIPSGREEAVRATIQAYLHVRRLERDMRGDSEDALPVKRGDFPLVAVNDCINLINSDLLSCTVVMNKNERLSRFLVTDGIQLILVEPDSSKAGWAVVSFVGLLQDTQITGDPADSRALHIVVEGPPGRSPPRFGCPFSPSPRRSPLLTAKLVFDDHIRCMAAKQRLSKGRASARSAKLTALCDVIGIKRPADSSPRGNPFRVASGCAPGSVRKQQPLSSDAPSSSSSDIPDDPHVGMKIV